MLPCTKVQCHLDSIVPRYNVYQFHGTKVQYLYGTQLLCAIETKAHDPDRDYVPLKKMARTPRVRGLDQIQPTIQNALCSKVAGPPSFERLTFHAA